MIFATGLSFDGGWAEAIKAMLDANVDKILLLAGVVFLLVAVVGKISGKIEPDSAGRKGATAIGILFVVFGLGIHFFPEPKPNPVTPTGPDVKGPNLSPPKTGRNWVALRDLTSEEFHNKFVELRDKGYRPLCVSGYRVGDEDRYSTLWAESFEPGSWNIFHGLSQSAFAAADQRQQEKNLQLKFVNVFDRNGKPIYSAIWNDRSAPDYLSMVDLTNSDFHHAVDQKKQEGLRPVFATAYSIADVDKYAVIFEKNPGLSWELRDGLSLQEYQGQFDELAKSGYSVTAVSGYSLNGKEVYLGLWEKVTGPPMVTNHGVPEGDYDSDSDHLENEGFSMFFVEGFNSGQHVKFNWVWQKGDPQ
ncbi:MAG TPA: hypothetical protein VN875_17590 [Candidatus Binatus sp.]|nr:hypothetical protein [Candidatus Binatus sp.]